MHHRKIKDLRNEMKRRRRSQDIKRVSSTRNSSERSDDSYQRRPFFTKGCHVTCDGRIFFDRKRKEEHALVDKHLGYSGSERCSGVRARVHIRAWSVTVGTSGGRCSVSVVVGKTLQRVCLFLIHDQQEEFSDPPDVEDFLLHGVSRSSFSWHLPLQKSGSIQIKIFLQSKGILSKNKKLKIPCWRCYIHSQEDEEKTMHLFWSRKVGANDEEHLLEDRHPLVEYDADGVALVEKKEDDKEGIIDLRYKSMS